MVWYIWIFPPVSLNQDIELKVSFATPEQDLPQDQELEEILAHAKPASNLAEYAGTITLTAITLD